VVQEVPVDLTKNSYLTPSGTYCIFDITEFLPGKEDPSDYHYESQRRDGGTWVFIPAKYQQNYTIDRLCKLLGDDQDLGTFFAQTNKYPALQDAMLAAIRHEVYNSIIGAFIGRFRFLSNFYPAKVRYESTRFPTVEHAYQAAKFLADVEVLVDGKVVRLRTLILEAKTPGKAKRLARKYAHLQRPSWKKEKLSIMRELVRQKFSCYNMSRRLIQTGHYQIIEGNGWGDTFWGMCGGNGKNHLGKILMELRKEFRTDDYPL